MCICTKGKTQRAELFTRTRQFWLLQGLAELASSAGCPGAEAGMVEADALEALGALASMARLYLPAAATMIPTGLTSYYFNFSDLF